MFSLFFVNLGARFMKSISYILAMFLLFSFTIREDNAHEVKITSGSFLYIKGTSNVNTFTCNYSSTGLERKIPVEFRRNGNVLHFKNVSMKLENKGFDCGNRGINRDFLELLKTESYPVINFQLLEVDKNHAKPQARVAIEIAGKKKNYTFPVEINGNGEKIDGTLCLNITDFGLEPPRKMMGMIVVREDIEINFGFEIQVLE